jgi:hypothetical protein
MMTPLPYCASIIKRALLWVLATISTRCWLPFGSLMRAYHLGDIQSSYWVDNLPDRSNHHRAMQLKFALLAACKWPGRRGPFDMSIEPSYSSNSEMKLWGFPSCAANACCVTFACAVAKQAPTTL